MYLLLPTGDECVMYAGRHGHVPCTEQRDFHVPSPPLSKQWLLLRNTTPREREPGEKNTWPVYLMCTCTQADPETPSRRAPEKEQVGIRLARFRHVRYGPPKQMQTLLPCAAAQRGCKIQLRGPSLVPFKTSNRQMALGIPSALWHAASSPRLPLEETNNKIPCGILGHPYGYVRGSLSVNRPDAMP